MLYSGRSGSRAEWHSVDSLPMESRLLGEHVVSLAEIQYVSDESGNTVAVLVPIELWREIESERETDYLLNSEIMKLRLLEAKNRQEGISIDEASEKLGI